MTIHIFKGSLGLVYWEISGTIVGGQGTYLMVCGICFTLQATSSLSIKETSLCYKVSMTLGPGKDKLRPGGRMRA